MRAARAAFGILFLVGLAVPAPASAAVPAVDRGMEAASPGGFFSPGVRVIVGDTVEVWRDGGRVGIGLIGMDAPEGNTRCGVRASTLLWRLTGEGARFERDPAMRFDDRSRRMYYGHTADGRSIAMRMVRRGLAEAVWEGKERRALRAAEREARAADRGCLWRAGPNADARTSALQTPSVQSPSGASAAVAASALVPSGFSEQAVAAGFSLSTSFAFLPDGRILVAEKDGLVRVVKDGQVLATPLIDIRDEVNDYWDRGLIGVAVDPGFSSNGYVYLYYTYENNPGTYESLDKTARVTRVTVSGNTAPRSSEVTILGSVGAQSCNLYPIGTDCIPTDSPGHSTGDIEFASDGTMFVTTGDGAHWNRVDDNALRAQNLDLLSGKLLHVTPLGKGLPSNPFWNGDPDANRSKVYAYGLRNAYRIGLRPGTDVPYVADVGWNRWEELTTVVSPGANLGWPCYEGSNTSGYSSKPLCQTLYNQGASAVRAPIHEYSHDGISAAITGGVFYTGTSYPSTYQGAYFFADYARNWIKYIRVNSGDGIASGPTDFATDAGAPVDVKMGPDGYLYYLSIYPSELRRICYGGCPQPPPTGDYRSEVLADQPLGYWRLGEQSGTTAVDASGSGRNGTYVNGPTLGAPGLLSGDSDTAVAFDGANDYVEVPDAPVWNLTGDLTIEALVNVTGGANYRTIVAKHSATGDVPTFEFRVRDTGALEFVQRTTAGTFVMIASRTLLANGTTYHVAVTKSGSTVTLYINGSADRTATFSTAIASNTRPVRIGMRDGSKPFGGRIDEVAIYNKALSSTRIQVHNTARTATTNQPPNPTISSPSPTLRFKVGDTITYSGSATDPEDGTIPPSGLSWEIRLHHCPGGDCHIHPYLSSTGTGGSFTVPDHGDEIHFEIVLKATDSGGKTATTSVTILPLTSTLTLETSPTGLILEYDGQSVTAPFSIGTVVGSTHSIRAPDQGGGTFQSWSDGGAQEHLITITTSNATYTATFSGSSSSAYASAVLADQPLGYWRLGEQSGTTAADASGSGRNGTYVNGPTLGVQGLLSNDTDKAVSLNGTNQFVEVPNALVWDLTGDLTIEALINITGGANYRTIVAKHSATGDVPTYEFRVRDTGALEFVQKTTGGTFQTIASTTALATGTTYHVAVTKSGSTVTLYINGVANRTATFSTAIASNTRPVRFGMRDGTKPLGGRIDEVAIYGRALSSTRIKAHADAR